MVNQQQTAILVNTIELNPSNKMLQHSANRPTTEYIPAIKTGFADLECN